jgi:hypothetical protein
MQRVSLTWATSLGTNIIDAGDGDVYRDNVKQVIGIYGRVIVFSGLEARLNSERVRVAKRPNSPDDSRTQPRRYVSRARG